MTLNTIALELVPPNVEHGTQRAGDDAHKVLEHSKTSGIEGRIRHVMIPGMIEEEDDRPVEMKPKLDVLDFWSAIQPELPGLSQRWVSGWRTCGVPESRVSSSSVSPAR